MVFLSPFKEILGCYPNAGRDCFFPLLPDTFDYRPQPTSYFTLYKICSCDNKWTTGGENSTCIKMCRYEHMEGTCHWLTKAQATALSYAGLCHPKAEDSVQKVFSARLGWSTSAVAWSASCNMVPQSFKFSLHCRICILQLRDSHLTFSYRLDGHRIIKEHNCHNKVNRKPQLWTYPLRKFPGIVTFPPSHGSPVNGLSLCDSALPIEWPDKVTFTTCNHTRTSKYKHITHN